MRKGENIYKRKDGRWEGRYIKERDGKGSIKYGYLYSKSYSELKEKLTLMKALHHKYYVQKADAITVTMSQWCEEWFSLIQRRVKHSTYVSYVNKIRKHIIPSLGCMKLSEITPDCIQKVLNVLGTSLNANSVRTIYQVMKTCLEDAVNKQLLHINPCKKIMPPKAISNKIKALTKKEHQSLYRCALKDDKGLSVILALDSGLRIGEISGLQWTDIDFSSKSVHIRRTVQRLQTFNPTNKNKTTLYETFPKSTAAERTIPLSKTVIQLLNKQRRTSHGKYVFLGNNPCEPRIITNWFKKICLKAQIPSISFHSLRHTFATRCIEKGVTIATISSLLGHSSIKMTLDTYINSFLSEKREAIQLISRIFEN